MYKKNSQQKINFFFYLPENNIEPSKWKLCVSVEMTDVVFKYVSWPFNQKDFRGNFIIENEHKVTKSTIAFPFNSLCESICRMRNYCARYCTSIVDSDFDHIELRGLYSKKEKN